MKVDIVTPERLVWRGQASEVRLPAWNGQIGILPGHEAILSLMRGGILVIVTSDGEQKFLVGRGLVQASNDEVSLLCDQCLDWAKVDLDKMRGEAAQAAEQLATAHEGSIEWNAAQERLERATAATLG